MFRRGRPECLPGKRAITQDRPYEKIRSKPETNLNGSCLRAGVPIQVWRWYCGSARRRACPPNLQRRRGCLPGMRHYGEFSRLSPKYKPFSTSFIFSCQGKLFGMTRLLRQAFRPFSFPCLLLQGPEETIVEGLVKIVETSYLLICLTISYFSPEARQCFPLLSLFSDNHFSHGNDLLGLQCYPAVPLKRSLTHRFV